MLALIIILAIIVVIAVVTQLLGTDRAACIRGDPTAGALRAREVA